MNGETNCGIDIKKHDDDLKNVSATLKKIRIQSGVVARLIKEHKFYVSESDRILAEVEQMKVRCHFSIAL